MKAISSLIKLGLGLAILVLLTGDPLWSQVAGEAVEDRTYDFGLIPLGTVIHHTFTLRNNGKKALIVGKVSTSCGCTQIASYPKRIAEGDHGDFMAVMDHQHTGYTDIVIYVPTGPSIHDLYTFHLVGVLVDKASLAPVNPALIGAQAAVAAVSTSKNVELVDVRSIDLYVQSHARGSLNVSPFALEAREDLKAKTVILVNDGIADPALLAYIDRLKSIGFKDVHLLAGGLRAWQLAGGTLEGTPNSSLAQLSPNDFYSEQRSPNGWLVVDLDNTPASIPTAYPVTHIPLGTDPKAFVKKLASALVDQPGVLHVLIASGQGNGYDQIESMLSGAKLSAPVYYLQGGSHAYITYSREQTLALNPQKDVMGASKASLASSQINGQVVHGGGCASCGH